MPQKILRLSPIDPEFEAEENVEAKTARVFNLDKIEIRATKNNFLIKTEMGEIILEEDDELLIDRLLLQVNFKYRTEREEEDSWTSRTEEDLDEPEEFLAKQRKPKPGKDHPLAFLFNNPHDDETHD